VLLVTLVVLLVLATLGYNLASRVAAQRHRNSYLIDYTVACYARDSAVKYTLTTLKDLNNIQLISRPNEPDFSDLFNLSEPDYRRLLAQWAEELARQAIAKDQSALPGDANGQPGVEPNGLNVKLSAKGSVDSNEGNSVTGDYAAEINETNTLNPATAGKLVTIRGPYGPSWPFVTAPVEFEIGSATVKIEVEDEGAKYPLGWAVIDDANVQREAKAGLETFCEWMGFKSDQIKSLEEQLKQVASIKPFKVVFPPAVKQMPVTFTAPSTRRRGARQQRTAYRLTKISSADQINKQARDFSKLFHGSLIDTDMLAAPTIVSEDRKESALKYMDLWGATQVNINSAPRQVLEAAFTFGGDADQIAAEIIKQRREKPFASIDELKKQLFKFSDSIDKCKPYITTTSNVFTIHVTAVSGVAKASAIIVVFKDGDKIERIAVTCG
jgi:hypothetical protein